jgi:hypothetical protein
VSAVRLTTDLICGACRELLRYRQFLGIQKERQAIAEAEAALKNKVDFTSPLTLSTIDATRAEGTPADRYILSLTPLHMAERLLMEFLKCCWFLM